MLKVSFMRFHKPRLELCENYDEFIKWEKIYNDMLESRKKSESRKLVNSKACKKQYIKRKGLL